MEGRKLIFATVCAPSGTAALAPTGPCTSSQHLDEILAPHRAAVRAEDQINAPSPVAKTDRPPLASAWPHGCEGRRPGSPCSALLLAPLEHARWLVSLLQAIGVAVHQTPFVLEAEDVRHAVRPFDRLVHPLHQHAKRLDVGRVSELPRRHQGQVTVADGPALELLARPI